MRPPLIVQERSVSGGVVPVEVMAAFLYGMEFTDSLSTQLVLNFNLCQICPVSLQQHQDTRDSTATIGGCLWYGYGL